MNTRELLRCILDETRFSMLEMLGPDGEIPVGEIAQRLDRDQPLVSHHLRILRECGLVSRRQDGRLIKYRVSSPEIYSLIGDVLDTGGRIGDLCAGGGAD